MRMLRECCRPTAWAARYYTWLLIKLMPKGVVFSSSSFLSAGLENFERFLYNTSVLWSDGGVRPCTSTGAHSYAVQLHSAMVSHTASFLRARYQFVQHMSCKTRLGPTALMFSHTSQYTAAVVYCAMPCLQICNCIWHVLS